jgi:hypothetical protein
MCVSLFFLLYVVWLNILFLPSFYFVTHSCPMHIVLLACMYSTRCRLVSLHEAAPFFLNWRLSVFPDISFFVVPLQQSSALLKFGFYVLTKFLLTILHVTMSSFLIRKKGCAPVCILEIMQLTIFTETTTLILAKDVFSYSHMCVLYIHVSDLNMCDSALFRERRKFLLYAWTGCI